jgi:hypothetical protein
MPDKLFLSSLNVEGGRVLLGFEVGRPVSLGESRKVSDLADGSAEYEQELADGEDRFTLRVTVGPDGGVTRAVATARDVPGDPGGQT